MRVFFGYQVPRGTNHNPPTFHKPMIMIAVLCLVVPGVVYAGLPWLIHRNTGKPPIPRGLLVVAWIVYVVSWTLPSPLIERRDTNFTTHLVGGGIFAGFIWLYAKRQMQWRATRLAEAASLFALVSALGVANELFELALVKTNPVHLDLSDTTWDLLANTLGALVFWVGFELTKTIRKYTCGYVPLDL